MSLTKDDISIIGELIEKKVETALEGFAVIVARSFQHSEERMDTLEAKLEEKIDTLEEKLSFRYDRRLELLEDDVRILKRKFIS